MCMFSAVVENTHGQHPRDTFFTAAGSEGPRLESLGGQSPQVSADQGEQAQRREGACQWRNH